jgi:acetylornithine deacetylase
MKSTIKGKINMKDLENVLSCVNSEETIRWAMEMVDIASPTGQEGEMAHYLENKFKESGLRTRFQEVEDDRWNVLGLFQGSGGGATLMFNGHLDTSYSGNEPGLPKSPAYQPKAYREDDWIFGLGIFNMKAAHAAYLGAIRAIQKSGIDIKGDVLHAGVVGEIERGPVDRYQGKEYRGGGCGARHLVTHGGRADVCVVGEPSSLMIVQGHMGYVWTKVTTYGTPAHTRLAHYATNAVDKMHDIISAIREWAPIYRKRNAYHNVDAGVNLSAIEGGWPFRATRTAVECNLYMDTRIHPEQNPLEIHREIEGIVRKLQEKDPNLKADVELYMTQPGSEIPNDHFFLHEMKKSHYGVFGSDPVVTHSGYYSDATVMHRYGIPSLNYGPSGRFKEGVERWDPEVGEHVNIEDLINCTKVYAALIFNICNVSPDQARSRVSP